MSLEFRAVDINPMIEQLQSWAGQWAEAPESFGWAKVDALLAVGCHAVHAWTGTTLVDGFLSSCEIDGFALGFLERALARGFDPLAANADPNGHGDVDALGWEVLGYVRQEAAEGNESARTMEKILAEWGLSG